MAAIASLQIVQGSPKRSHFPFLGQNHLPSLHQRPHSVVPKESRLKLKPYAKFNLSEILGGRGICNGEQGLLEELKRNVDEQRSSDDAKVEDSGSLGSSSAEGFPERSSDDAKVEDSGSLVSSSAEGFPEDAFGKELMGLTGGFPGGEKGLQKFIHRNPPPKNQ